MSSGRWNPSGLAAVAISLVILSSAAFARTELSPVERAAQEDEIRAAVLRYQMLRWSTQGDRAELEARNESERRLARELNYRIYFISINGRDPGNDFVKRFQDLPRQIRKVSQCKRKKRFLGWVVDKKTKQNGIVFSADSIRWLTPDQVEVDGGYHCGKLCGGGEVFSMQLQDGKWVVTETLTSSIP